MLWDTLVVILQVLAAASMASDLRRHARTLQTPSPAFGNTLATITACLMAGRLLFSTDSDGDGPRLPGDATHSANCIPRLTVRCKSLTDTYATGSILLYQLSLDSGL